MAIAVTCGSCGNTFRVKNVHAGLQVTCPACAAELLAKGTPVSDHDVFISLAQTDKTVADTVCHALEDQGIRCWIAPRDVPPGAEWGSAIIDAIGGSRVMILIFSAQANESQQVLREVTKAVNAGVAILPFRTENIVPSKSMDYYLAPLHWLDAVTPPLESHIQALVSRVEALLKEKGQVPLAEDRNAGPGPRTREQDAVASYRKKARLALAASGVMCLLALVIAATAFFRYQSLDVEARWEASNKEGTLILPGAVTMEFVLIPPETFLMGSPGDEKDRSGVEGPQREVTMASAFWMGKYEVTQAQWAAVMGDNPSRFRGDDRPVEQVSWDDCQRFVRRLNTAKQGEFRLPTEAEWEYACRAGSTTRYYSGCDEARLADYAWYDANSGGITHPVGQKLPNALGLYDMTGNVWEWCQDWFHNTYEGAPVDGSAWQDPAGMSRVLRGGAINRDSTRCRSAYRINDPPDARNNNTGVRLVRTP